MQMFVTIEEAQAKLKELIQDLASGEEFIITQNQRPVAMLVGVAYKVETPPRPGPGLLKESIVYMSPDFDSPQDDMREYMEGDVTGPRSS
jgi:prevent-host-death family protein